MITVIIVTYNGQDWIGNCVNSVLSSDIDTSIIIVDNASTDNTISEIPRQKNIEVIRSSENIGFGRANNIGITIAIARDSKYVFLLNQDATVERSCISALQEVLAKNPDYGIVSPLHLNGGANNFDRNFLAFYLAQSNSTFLFDSYNGVLNDVYEVSAINAAAWMLPRGCIEQNGGFDPLYFMYAEDDDYLFRVRRNGFKIGLVSKAKILHYRSNEGGEKKGSRLGYIDKIRNRERSEMIFFLKGYKGGMLRACLELSARNLAKFVKLLVVDRYPLNLTAFLWAVFQTITILPSIKRHRDICEHRGSHWVS